MRRARSRSHWVARNHRGRVRTCVPSNPQVEKAFGLKGWHYGMLRANAFARMMECLPEGILVADHEFRSYREGSHDIEVSFTNGNRVEADILVGLTVFARGFPGRPLVNRTCSMSAWGSGWPGVWRLKTDISWARRWATSSTICPGQTQGPGI